MKHSGVILAVVVVLFSINVCAARSAPNRRGTHALYSPEHVEITQNVGAQQANLWPLPQSVTQGSQSVTLDHGNFHFKCTGKSCSVVLSKAFERYVRFIFFDHAPEAGKERSANKNKSPQAITLVEVNADSFPALDYGVDESYNISVTSTSATINAATEWGALRGIETFSQLVNYDFTNDIYSINNLPVTINDKPRFGWRGLLIDSSRHYLPLPAILRTIDAMSFNKFNVLHWHIVDSQSFPVQSSTYPLLSEKGAWAPRAIYTHPEVKAVISYAFDRGIRVMPEFDTPGHADCWGNGYPDLFPKCPNSSPVFDVTKNYTINFMSNFLAEMTTLFTDSFVHLGGDEVTFDCWKADPSIQAFMTKNGIASYAELQGYYEKLLQNIVNGLHRTPVYWDEVFGESQKYALDKSAVVNVWNKDQSELINVVKQGYRGVFSTPWYLDRQIPDPDTYYLWGDTWIAFYKEDPVGSSSLTPDQLARILGVEASMWGEQVDFTDIDVRVWPRACAVGERGWSAQSVTDVNQARQRLAAHRCRMVRRGISAFPVQPDYCYVGRAGLDQWTPSL